MQIVRIAAVACSWLWIAELVGACQTVVDGAACEFPFRYKNTTYESCTDVDRGKAWCSTTFEYDETSWGYCGASCENATSDLVQREVRPCTELCSPPKAAGLPGLDPPPPRTIWSKQSMDTEFKFWCKGAPGTQEKFQCSLRDTACADFGEQHLTKVTYYVDCAMPNQEIVRRFLWVHDREYKCMAPVPAIPVGWFSWGEPDVSISFCDYNSSFLAEKFLGLVLQVFSVLWGYAYVAIRNKFFGKSWVLITAFLAVPAPFPILVAGIFAWLTRQREQSCSAVFFIVCWGSGLTVIDVLVGMAQGISDFKSSKKSDDSEPTCSLKLAVKVAWVLFDASINVYNAIISLKEVEEDITCGYDSWLKAIAYTNILNACLGTLSLCAVHMCKISQPNYAADGLRMPRACASARNQAYYSAAGLECGGGGGCGGGGCTGSESSWAAVKMSIFKGAKLQYSKRSKGFCSTFRSMFHSS